MNSEHDTRLAIAVIGLAGRFPGAADPAALWANLRAGAETISFLTEAELLSAGESPERLRDPDYVRASGRLADIAGFDAAFFGMSPRDAAVFDPQHRLFLECAWEAFEDAGYVGDRITGQVGVFASSGAAEYFMYNLLPNRRVMDSVGAWLARHNGNDQNFLATRVSYELNLNGPSMSVQTACSSSLVAVHVACQSLLNGECDVALAGGSTVYAEQNRGYLYKQGEILSPDGHCRAFDAKSAGTVMASAVGCVVLKRLADALDGGDRILAVIRGSAINNDGSEKVGYLAPSVSGQTRVISEALAIAGVQADDVSYVEAHGTATAIGDPIEILALTEAFRSQTSRKQFCAIGSLKTNLGHAGEAAGICSFIKTVLALHHREIPASLHYETPNPQIDFANSPFFVNTALRQWTGPPGKPRIAGVTSLGAGGTNVHVIVEEAPPQPPSAPSRDYQLLVLSAKTQSALDRATERLAAYVRSHPTVQLADVACTLLAGRTRFAHRRTVVVRDAADCLAALEGGDRSRLTTQFRKEQQPPKVFFMFPGGGAQYAGMGAELYARESGYRAAFDEALSHAPAAIQSELRALALATPDEAAQAHQWLEAPSRALPALLATEYATAKLLQSWGIQPDAAIGHSAGEYAAACLAGVITIRDAMALVAVRGRLFETLPEGGMLSVALPVEEARAFMGAELSVAAVNAPSLCVWSGTVAAIAAAHERLQASGIECARLHIQVAAHSPMVGAIVGEFERFCRTIAFERPKIPFVSNVTGTWITDEEATDPTYWARHLRAPVRFSEGAQTLLETAEGAFCEIGPGRTLSSLVRQQKGSPVAVAATLRHPDEKRSDVAFLLNAVGQLWLAGVPLDETRLFAGERRRRVALPTYPFERQRHWVDPDPRQGRNEGSGALTKRPDIGEWFYAPSWSRSAPPRRAAVEPATWLVFTDGSQLADAVVTRLRRGGHTVVEVEPAEQFATLGPGRYGVDPAARSDFDTLAKELRRSGTVPRRIVHFWAAAAKAARGGSGRRRAWHALDAYNRGLSLNYFSLIYIAQAFAADSEALRLYCVSSHMQSLPGDAEMDPEKAVLLGPCRVIPREYPHVSCTSIDLVWQESAQEEVATRLMLELEGGVIDSEVALRGTDRWVRRFDPVRLEPVSERPWLRDGGVYIVTGGIGGIGLQIAEHLARSARGVKLALISRTPLPAEERFAEWLASQGPDDETSRRIAALGAIRAQGAEVMTIAADVADVSAVSDALARVHARYGAVNGAFHAAGVLSDEIIALRAPAANSAVIDPKMKGALVLDALLAGEPLDFFVFFSSVSSILGLPGQAEYTAANAFLDAFAHARARRGPGRTLAINWNAWQEVGMLATRVRRDHDDGAYARRTPIDDAPDASFRARTSHPSLETIVSDDAGATLFRTSFRRSGTWLLEEHVVRGGDAVIPGTGFLEIVRAALEHRKEARAVELRDVLFLAPFAVGPDGERTLHVRIDRRGEGQFSCYGESEKELFVVGKARYANPPTAERLDLNAMRARCTRSGDVANGQLAQHFMDFGPRWANVKRIDLGQREALVSLELRTEFTGDLETFHLHPALFDLATGGAQALVPGFDARAAFYVPFSYGRVLLRRPLCRRVSSHIRLREVGKESIVFDATLVDENGEEIASVERFTMRKVSPGFVVRAPGSARAGEAPRAAGASRAAGTRRETPAQQALREGMTPAEGLEALDRMLAIDFSPQVVACTVPLHAWLDRLAEEAKGALIQDISSASDAAGSTLARPNAGPQYVPPQDHIERELASLWCGLLGATDIGVTDDFFELGGQSLVAVRLFQRINKKYGVDLPLATLFNAPTIAECAALIREQLGLPHPADDQRAPSDAAVAAVAPAPPVHAGRALVRLQRGDGRPPFFCVHGAGGNVLNFRHLARAMDPGQPVFGLQAAGLDGVSPPHKTIEEMAAAYLAEVRELQPHGPYLLGGYSGGGIVAFEMARRLTDCGEAVGLLALIDTFHPEMAIQHSVSSRRRLQRLRTEGLAYVSEVLERRRQFMKDAKDARLIDEHLERGEAVPLELRDHYLSRNFKCAVLQYVPKPWPGRAILFRAETIDRAAEGRGLAYGWDREILGGVEIMTVPGDHTTLVLGANVERLVRFLSGAITGARRSVDAGEAST